MTTEAYPRPAPWGADYGSTPKVPLFADPWGWQPRSVILRYDPDLVLVLRGALVGVSGLLLLAVLPAGDASVIVQVGMLVALWLCLASVLVFAARHGIRSQPPRASHSAALLRPHGQVPLRKRGDGRHVEIVSEGVVLAEVKATDLRDEIELHAVPSDGLEELGSALGQAIELVSDADEAHLDWDDHGASEDWTDQPSSKGW